MNDKFTTASLYARYIIAAVVVSSAVVFNVRKFDAPSEVISQQEADAVCQSVPKCKKIQFGRYYRGDSAVPSLKISVRADRNGKNPDLRTQIESKLGQLWEANARFYSVGWEGKALEVKYE